MSAITWTATSPAAPSIKSSALVVPVRRLGFGLALIGATGTLYAALLLRY